MSQTIKLKEIQRHDSTSFADNEIVELKKWKLEEILEKYSLPNPPFNPRISDYDLPRAGFEDVGSIDLRILFGDW